MEIIKAKRPKIVKTGRPLKYPFDKLQVGECLTIGPEDNAISIGQAARQYSRKHPTVKLSVRANAVYRIKQ